MTSAARLALALLGAALCTSTANAAPNIRLTDEGHNSIRPRVALDPQRNAVVVWQDDRYGNHEILWQKFDLDGNALTPVVRVTNSAAVSARPDVSCDAAGNSHVVWQEGDNINAAGGVWFCKLDGSGTKIVNDVAVYSLAGDARVAALPNGETNVVYQRRMPADQDVFLRHLGTTGVQTCEKHLSGTPNSYSKTPCLANATDGSARVLWPDLGYFFDWYLGSAQISTSCGGGQTSIYGDHALNPTVDIAGATTFMAFELGSNIYRVTDAGSTCRLPVGTGTCTQPVVATEAAESYLAWRDSRDGNSEIYYCRASGCTNASGDVRLTNAAGNSENPDMATPKDGSGSWVIVWSDARDGNTEIYLTSRQLIEPPYPDAPTNAVATLSTLTCPPSCVVAWQDQSTNETSFVIEREVDGSGSWSQVGVEGAGIQTTTDVTTTYGHSYRYRVHACNGPYCSTDAVTGAVPVEGQMRWIEGTVRATVLDRGENNSPTVQPLPRVRVSVLRDGQPIYSSQPTGMNGSYTLGAASVRCDDQIAIVLVNDELKVEDRNVSGPDDYCLDTPTVQKVFALPSGSPIDLTWPVEEGNISGEAPNALYWNEHAFADYWQWLDGATLRSSLHTITRFPAPDPYYRSCPPHYYVTHFGRNFALFRSAIVHEFNHSIIHRNAGLAESGGNGQEAHPAAGPIDEAMADYFTAAWSGESKMYPAGWRLGAPIVLRDLASQKQMPACGGTYQSSGNRYGESLALSGALWNWRDRLVNDRRVAPADVDRAVLAAMVGLCQRPAPDRSFLSFRADLEGTAPGTDHRADLEWAFDRHNIKYPADDHCLTRPQAAVTMNHVVGQERHVEISWTPAPEAASYRVYAQRWPGSSTALGTGDLVADSVTATTYTHVEPDTSTVLAFVVVVLGADGEEGAASEETPRVSGVVAPPSSSPVRALVAFPNPSSGGFRVSFTAVLGPAPRVEVFDVSGRRRRATSARLAPSREWSWDGRDDDGRPTEPGIYLLRASSGAVSAAVRVVVTR